MQLIMMSAIATLCLEASSLGQSPAARPSPAPVPAAAIAIAAAQDALPSAPSTGRATGPSTNAEPPAAISEDAVLDEEQSPVTLAFEGESDDAVVQRLVAYLEKIKTLQGDFVQTSPSGAVSEGRFYLRRPGMLRFEYDPPTPLLIVANSGMVYVRDDALETTDSYPAGRTPLKFLLSDKIDLDKATVTAVDRGVDTVAVTLSSDDAETEGELSIIVSAPDMALRRWIVRDRQNGITVVSLDNVLSGDRLANRLFRAPEAGGEFLKN